MMKVLMRKCAICGKLTSNPKYCSKKCYGESLRGKSPWNKGKKGVQRPWNKGKSANPDSVNYDCRLDYMLGENNSAKRLEVRKKISMANRGRHVSEKTKNKLSQIMQGHPSPMKGKHHTEEAKEKSRLAHLGHKPNKNQLEGLKKGRFRGKKHSEATKKKIKEARLRQVTPRKDTIIERIVQESLKKRGISFETHYPIIGQPDVAFPNKKIAVFCDGCYWHGCPLCFPNNNNNHRRDEYVNNELVKEGWKPLRFWAHEIKNNSEGCLDAIIEAIL